MCVKNCNYFLILTGMLVHVYSYPYLNHYIWKNNSSILP